MVWHGREGGADGLILFWKALQHRVLHPFIMDRHSITLKLQPDTLSPDKVLQNGFCLFFLQMIEVMLPFRPSGIDSCVVYGLQSIPCSLRRRL